MRRLVREAAHPVERAGLLAAHVEVALAADDPESARIAGEELGALAEGFDSAYLRAVADFARGSVLLADGDAQEASPAFRRALTSWQELVSP